MPAALHGHAALRLTGSRLSVPPASSWSVETRHRLSRGGCATRRSTKAPSSSLLLRFVDAESKQTSKHETVLHSSVCSSKSDHGHTQDRSSPPVTEDTSPRCALRLTLSPCSCRVFAQWDPLLHEWEAFTTHGARVYASPHAVHAQLTARLSRQLFEKELHQTALRCV